MRNLFTLPTDNDRTIADQYVKREWVVFGAYAWKMYQERGCGIVLLNAHTTKRLKYLTDVNQPPFATRMGVSLPRLVAEYDPEREAVVMITAPYNSLTETMRSAGNEFDELVKHAGKGDIEDRLQAFEARLEEGLRAGAAAREYAPLGVDPPPASEAKPPIVTIGVYAHTPSPPDCKPPPPA